MLITAGHFQGIILTNIVFLDSATCCSIMRGAMAFTCLVATISCAPLSSDPTVKSLQQTGNVLPSPTEAQKPGSQIMPHIQPSVLQPLPDAQMLFPSQPANQYPQPGQFYLIQPPQQSQFYPLYPPYGQLFYPAGYPQVQMSNPAALPVPQPVQPFSDTPLTQQVPPYFYMIPPMGASSAFSSEEMMVGGRMGIYLPTLGDATSVAGGRQIQNPIPAPVQPINPSVVIDPAAPLNPVMALDNRVALPGYEAMQLGFPFGRIQQTGQATPDVPGGTMPSYNLLPAGLGKPEPSGVPTMANQQINTKTVDMVKTTAGKPQKPLSLLPDTEVIPYSPEGQGINMFP
ncbi:AT-rich interactive domain-containing protein 2-like [Denticeps clupeoides]|uniref:AT-rich interactive domain-containing protein 2-like n=1 Tax=Denticeps clupeoides TaxID=299321 RepID=UPI0010A49F3E|nr:AT-rich interactive domain-containing protein 2-like [Denticeps clupeoides]